MNICAQLLFFLVLIRHHEQVRGFSSLPSRRSHHSLSSSTIRRTARYQTKSDDTPSLFTHSDIVWKLRPSEDLSTLKKLQLKTAAKGILLDCKLKKIDPPFCLCPKGGKALLEATYKGQQIGRFGITTQRGPPAPEIDASFQETYNVTLKPGVSVGSAAIIYMVVQPEYRGCGVGYLALEVISCIQAQQGCDLTLLVADDDGTDRLVKWYEGIGFSRAPLLQTILGSPNQEYGITMIRPTTAQVPPNCQLKWW